MRTVIGPTDRVVIVGAGLGGLSCALRLAGAGRHVTVLERDDGPGGRAGQLRLDGYRFDTGPTVLTMPGLIEDAFGAVGESMNDWLELRPVEPLYRAFYPDGSQLDVHADPVRMAAEIEAVCGPDEAAGYLRFVDFVSGLYRLEMRGFIDRNLDSARDLVSVDGARLLARGGLRRLAPKVGSYLRDPRTRRIFSFQAMYAGLSPYQALALYAVIAYMDSVAGVFFPVGGMHAVPVALAAAAEKHGVDIRYGTNVTSVDVVNGRAVAVRTEDGDRITADVVVLNPDLPTAYATLLPPEYRPRRLERLAYSPSCFLLHVGSTAAYGRTTHHNLHFGQAWRQVFRELIRDQTLMSDPSLLVTNATHSDPGLAPPGRQSYYVLAPTPNTRSRLDWQRLGPRYRDEIVATLEARGYVGFGGAIEIERFVTPADWEALGLVAGAPFASSHTLRQTGPFRPANLAPGLENVVFTGSGTHPGVGVPMVLISGRLAAERVTGPSHSAGRTVRG